LTWRDVINRLLQRTYEDMQMIPRILRTTPVLTITHIESLLYWKTTALGGVETGNMKANEHEYTAGSIINNGFCSIDIEMDATNENRSDG
jgi:hypothetical protein